MITSIKIENFKQFSLLELPTISGITLIGGRNNIGKTSLLEAIFMFYDVGNPNLFLRHLAWRGVELVGSDPNTLIAPMFSNFNLGKTLRISLNDGIYSNKMEVSYNENVNADKVIDLVTSKSGTVASQLRTNITPITSYSLKIRYEVNGSVYQTNLLVKQDPNNLNIHFDSPLGDFPNGLRHTVIYLGLRNSVNAREDASRLSQLDVSKKTKQILEFLQILEPSLIGLSTVSLPEGNSSIYVDIGLENKIPASYMGDGFTRLLSIIMAIATAKNGIVLIDEIDAGVHYSIMTKVWEGISRAAQQFNCQVIATTHSYECLQSARDGMLNTNRQRDFSYIRLEKHEQDISAKTYSFNVFEAALEQGWELR